MAPWPEAGARDAAAEADMALVMEIVRGIRNARAEYNVKPGHAIAAVIAAGERAGVLSEQADVLCALARLDPAHLVIAEHPQAPAQALTLVSGDVTTYLPLADLVDLDAERAKLAKELVETEAQIARGEALLAGPFAQRAPANVVAKEQEKLAQFVAQAQRLRGRIADLG